MREHGFDAVIESALADADEFRASARAYRRSAHGSRSWPWPPRRPSASSGSWATYWPRAARTWRNHDTCAGVCRTLAVIEAEHLADRITVPALPLSSPATGRCSTRPDCAPTWTASGHLRDRTHALHARGVPAVKAPCHRPRGPSTRTRTGGATGGDHRYGVPPTGQHRSRGPSQGSCRIWWPSPTNWPPLRPEHRSAARASRLPLHLLPLHCHCVCAAGPFPAPTSAMHSPAAVTRHIERPAADPLWRMCSDAGKNADGCGARRKSRRPHSLVKGGHSV